ncbi:DUF4132 domain-containing protein [Hymenobacter sediminis]|uniref:DUF4132 domain-containing protein n=1 Tax=Hymenobacter sediminis TaxID=2218621 RepID=UPI000DA6426B|nr:DUF4132 domain-containing protein [Hymenobacter sediminis]RPD45398.1 DUF4132 domain-containing protein [Hymenobacter sediminis]
MSATKKKTEDSPVFDDSSPEAVEMKPILQELTPELLNRKYYDKVTDLPTYQLVKAQDAAYQGRLALALAMAIQRCTRQQDFSLKYAFSDLLGALMRGTLQLTDADYLRLFQLYGLNLADDQTYLGVWPYPLHLTMTQLARRAKKEAVGSELEAYLKTLLSLLPGNTSDSVKLRHKIQEVLGAGADEGSLPLVQFSAEDPFGRQLNEFIVSQDPATPATQAWLHLLESWQKASGAQPTVKYRKELDKSVAAIGEEQVRPRLLQWLELLATMPIVEQSQTVQYGNHPPHTYTTYLYLQEANVAVAKAHVWTAQPLANDAMIAVLATLAGKCYRKIPERGPVAVALGNACLLALAHNGLTGVAALARVRSKIRQSNIQTLIAKHIETASQKLGVSPAEIEDMAVSDFGLEAGRREEEFGEYKAVLTLAGGKAEIAWSKAGKALKSAPSALKATYAEELKELKNSQTQAQQTYTTQRERLDRSFVEGRRIPYAWFRQYYLEHGLMSQLAQPLIWRFHQPDGTFHDALWLDGAWTDAQQQPVPAPTPETLVQLWHPVLASTESVLAWRQLLEQLQVQQPLKQAFREVYLLTPPEERTNTYSNRMAAHVLKQHQFNSLAKLRGWRYSLMGAYDKGYESDSATLELPAHGLQAQFWVSEVNADNAWNDTGIWNYISTDQVRFATPHGVVPLPEVPPLVFSEVMRDVDLFVGVGSVGNDPLWRDNGGLPAYRNYWESYSFGELNEVAKNRKLALERLVPRMKIGKVSQIQDRFLVVRGKLRTYKIHLGSGNILMEPNDQYLCIVPDRPSKAGPATDVFLPFEGDAVLSIILSKALLLMDDDKITDPTITRQIKL